MIGVNAGGFRAGLPAIDVVRLMANRQAAGQLSRSMTAAEIVLETVKNPPRVGEARRIGDLMPEVLARYEVQEERVEVDLSA
jgi:hypothetical protein